MAAGWPVTSNCTSPQKQRPVRAVFTMSGVLVRSPARSGACENILITRCPHANDRASGARAPPSAEVSMDALSDVLKAVRLSGAVFFDIQAAEPWVAETPLGRSVVHAMFPGSEHMISYHVILEGSCWAIVEGEPPVQLSAGDVIVFPHGDTHVLTSTPGMRKKPTMSMYRRPTDGQLPFSISMGPAGAPAA